MSKTPRLPSTQLHGELQGVWLLSTPTLQLSRVYLPSTCDITHVITYTRPSSLLFYFWVRGRGRPGDEARSILCEPDKYAYQCSLGRSWLFEIFVRRIQLLQKSLVQDAGIPRTVCWNGQDRKVVCLWPSSVVEILKQ